MVPPVGFSIAANGLFSYADTIVGALVGATIASIGAVQVCNLKVRARFNDVIGRQRQRCRPLTDDAEFTLDDSIERHTLTVLERAREAIAPE